VESTEYRGLKTECSKKVLRVEPALPVESLVEPSSSKGVGFESAMNDEPGGDSEGNGWRRDITVRWDGLQTR